MKNYFASIERLRIVGVAAALIVTLALSVDATAFENIEADAYYDGPLKEQIANEYAATLGGLDAQAKTIGVEPRKKDIETAKNHFATKAVMMARCLDIGVSAKKMIVKDVDLKKYVSGCVETQLKFMAWMQAGGKVDDMCLLDNLSLRLRQEKPVYDFLKIEGVVPGSNHGGSHYDVIALRECHLESQKPLGERMRVR